MQFNFNYKGNTCKGNILKIEENDPEEFEVEYNNDKTIIFLSENDQTEEGELMWFQKAASGEKLWPEDLIAAIGEKIAYLDFYPDSFIVAFKENGIEYSAEILKNDNKYKIISYWLPDKSLNKKSYALYQSKEGKGKQWRLEGHVGPAPAWVDKIGKLIENHIAKS